MIDTEEFPISCVKNGVSVSITLCGYEQLAQNIIRIMYRDNNPPLFAGFGLGLLEDNSLLFLLKSGIELYLMLYGPKNIIFLDYFSVFEIKKEGENTVIIKY